MSALLFTLTQELDAVELSLRVAALATVASLPVGIVVAMVLARAVLRPCLFNALVLLPLILPPVVTGYVLLLLFGSRGRSARFSPRFRHRALFSLDRRRPRLRHHGLSADGAGDPALAGGG